ncbi:transglutaminase family protein [Lacisediminimonas sp.]|uniref:transglutaminase-like domain-containing protein n=1 Tax=Lacisediminimonas sp. TaxID=3060582 RepID=UPI002716ACDB|nr:transglutaminase-like domain-containing protein [Lacisediminimonas sp.]MDO8300509.1 transglutaminase-like domain-containing protein [Lacisediminimonas sp.]
MLRSSEDPEVLLKQVLAMFRQQNFRYTLAPPLLGQHTVDDFLFNTRAGFCEHYANAFVVLMRAMDIPARVVTGYQGGEMNQPGEYMTIRQSDAHAWAEVWLEGRGWVRIDPTAAVAPSRIEGSLRSALPQTLLGGLVSFNVEGQAWASAIRQLRMNWDALNNRWNQLVLDYSAGRQRDLLEALGFENPDWRTLTGLMMAALAIVMALIGLPLVRNRRHRDPLELLYERFCRSLLRQGQQPALHEGPQGWRQRLQATHAANPEKLRAWCEFLALYETMRYARPHDNKPAGAPAPEHGLSRLRKLLTLCR